jgi:hypothetical protein
MDKLQVFANERIGLPDFEDGAGGQLVLDDNIRLGRVLLLPSGRTTGQANTSGRVLSGFAVSGSGTATGTITRGTGIFPLFDESTVKYGLLQGDEGPATRTVDYSSAGSPANPFAIYVRAVYNEAETQNRVFWNPSGSPAAEFVDNIATRQASTWEVVSQDNAATPPGNGEYVKIAEVTVVANLITTITEFRHMYFEGSPHTTEPYAH